MARKKTPIPPPDPSPVPPDPSAPPPAERVTVRPLGDFKPNVANPRIHDPENLAIIGGSIDQFGPGRSLVAGPDGVIYCGNGTLGEAKKRGMKALVVKPARDEIVVVDRSDLDPVQATGLAIVDNHATDKSRNDDAKLLALLNALPPDVAKATGVSEADMALIRAAAIEQTEGDGTGDGAKGDGSLLARVEVTIGDPRHVVQPGETWQVGRHVLLIVDVFRDWEVWKPHLKDRAIFCPFPGPLVPLTVKAEEHELVMVQPDVYIAGHILDQFENVNGPSGIHRHD